MEERYAIEQTLLQRDNLVKVARACTRFYARRRPLAGSPLICPRLGH